MPPPFDVIVVNPDPEIDESDPFVPAEVAATEPLPPSPTVTVIVTPAFTVCVDVLKPPAPPPPPPPPACPPPPPPATTKKSTEYEVGDKASVPSLIPELDNQPCVESIYVKITPSLSPFNNTLSVEPSILFPLGLIVNLFVSNVPA